MSSLAASGGYWISMGADKNPSAYTLTGSIGIFGVITTFEKGLNDIGVYTDGVNYITFLWPWYYYRLKRWRERCVPNGH